MKINKDICIGCGLCSPYCTTNAITTVEWEGKHVNEIIQNECVECGVCIRAEICPVDAFFMPDLRWPRSVRAMFSDPVTQHPTTKLEGRGTEEMKTNDVTGRFTLGMVGMAVEMGRPGVSTTFQDVQTVCMELAKVDLEFEKENPVTSLIENKETGELVKDIMSERVLSAIIEFSINNDQLEEVLSVLKRVSKKIDTVFSLCLINRIDPDKTNFARYIAEKAGFNPMPNTKLNVGLGKPLKETN